MRLRDIGVILIVIVLMVIGTSYEVSAEIKYEGNPEEIKEPAYIDDVMIVNKQNPLPSTYEPDVVEYSGEKGEKKAVDAIKKMITEAEKEGIKLQVYSGYRSYEYQKDLYNKYVEKDGKKAADRYSARPGFSEHQTGLTFDVGEKGVSDPLTEDLGQQEEGIWIKDNAYKYGFVVRYPHGKEDITGYQYEPWHLRYVGKNVAKEIHESEYDTLEEFFDIVGDVIGEDKEEDKGSKKKPTKKEDDEETSLHAKGSEEFKSRDYAEDALGVKNTNNFIGGDLFLVIQNSSNNVMKVLMYVGVFLVGVLLLFTSASVAWYLVLSSNGASGNMANTFEKFTGTNLDRKRETMYKLLGRWVFVLVIVTVFLTGLYAPIMTGILSFLESITDYIFGLGG